MKASGPHEPGPRVPPKGRAIAKERHGGRWRGHVLVADAENQITGTLKETLSDHDVEIETQPNEFLRRIDRGDPFDVILCDVSMLQRIEPERWAQVAARHPSRAARIVFVTGERMSETARAALAAMPNLCVRRPFNVEGMRALVWRRTRERLSDPDSAGHG